MRDMRKGDFQKRAQRHKPLQQMRRLDADGRLQVRVYRKEAKNNMTFPPSLNEKHKKAAWAAEDKV